MKTIKHILTVAVFEVLLAPIFAQTGTAIMSTDEVFSEFLMTNHEVTETCVTSRNMSLGSYGIGDFGPGGGIVFYYSEMGFPVYESDDASPVICHYLECSSIEIGIITWCPCGDDWWCDVNTMDGIGTGKLNTKHILDSTHYNAEFLTLSNCAAYACSLYFTETTNAGDWYLPSKSELNLLYENLMKDRNIVGDKWHWSSLHSGSVSAWDQSFSDGFQGNQYKHFTNYVRAVRAF